MQYWVQEMEKQVGERLQILLTDPVLKKIYTKFGGEVFRRSSVFHGLGKFLADNDVKGQTCFEIGTWNGLTAAVLSRFFEEVVTVDIIHNAIKHEVLQHAGIRNVRCIDITSNEHKEQVANDLEFDFAYLDGNHAKDTPRDWAMTKKAGRVLFHEAWPFQKPVWDLVHTLPEEEVTWGGAGLALWVGRDL